MRVIALAVFLTLIAGSASFGQDRCFQPRSPDEGIAVCTKHIKSGRWSGAELAVKYFNRAISHTMKAKAPIGSFGHLGRAWKDYNEAIRLNPRYMEAYVNRGIVKMRYGNCRAAIADLDEAVRLGRREAQVYYNRARGYICLIGTTLPSAEVQPTYRRAILDYSRAIRLKPRYVRAYVSRGTAYRNMSKPQKALEDLNKAISMDPRNDGAYYIRAIVYADLKQYRRAAKEYGRAIRVNPKYLKAYLARGLLYQYKLKNRAKAIADYRAAYKLSPGNRRVRYLLRRVGAEP
jgi:tetratricopeptide (TPR) repeat protein